MNIFNVYSHGQLIFFYHSGKKAFFYQRHLHKVFIAFALQEQTGPLNTPRVGEVASLLSTLIAKLWFWLIIPLSRPTLVTSLFRRDLFRMTGTHVRHINSNIINKKMCTCSSEIHC